VAYERDVDSSVKSLISNLTNLSATYKEARFLNNGDMISDTDALDLVRDGPSGSEQPQSSPCTSRLKIKTRGATFTANRYGVFEVRLTWSRRSFFSQANQSDRRRRESAMMLFMVARSDRGLKAQENQCITTLSTKTAEP
jgi:hypothetical protein